MRNLSLHILDSMQNSVRARATCIKLDITEDISKNIFQIQIVDNGMGMNKVLKEHITDPFITTRTLRKVGLGIPFLKQICDECEGNLQIESEELVGTKIIATMKHDHIDRLPLGEIWQTITTLIMARPDIHYIYTHRYNKDKFVFDTQAISEILEGVPINELSILKWIEEYIEENLSKLSTN